MSICVRALTPLATLLVAACSASDLDSLAGPEIAAGGASGRPGSSGASAGGGGGARPGGASGTSSGGGAAGAAGKTGAAGAPGGSASGIGGAGGSTTGGSAGLFAGSGGNGGAAASSGGGGVAAKGGSAGSSASGAAGNGAAGSGAIAGAGGASAGSGGGGAAGTSGAASAGAAGEGGTSSAGAAGAGGAVAGGAGNGGAGSSGAGGSVASTCGNGEIDPGEECDGPSPAGLLCNSVTCRVVCDGGAAFRVPSTQRCFFLLDTNAPWSEARAACIASGATLAVLTSSAEREILADGLQATNDFWVGARQTGSTPTSPIDGWRWEDPMKTPVMPAAWADNEPNDGASGFENHEQDCARIRPEQGFRLGDAACSDLLDSLCVLDPPK